MVLDRSTSLSSCHVVHLLSVVDHQRVFRMISCATLSVDTGFSEHHPKNFRMHKVSVLIAIGEISYILNRSILRKSNEPKKCAGGPLGGKEHRLEAKMERFGRILVSSISGTVPPSCRIHIRKNRPVRRSGNHLAIPEWGRMARGEGVGRWNHGRRVDRPPSLPLLGYACGIYHLAQRKEEINNYGNRFSKNLFA